MYVPAPSPSDDDDILSPNRSIIATVEAEVARVLAGSNNSQSSDAQYLGRRRRFVDKETERVSQVMMGFYQ